MQANRYLKSKMMDHIDHALGRPVDPMRESYRNRYVASLNEAREFEDSAYWSRNYKDDRVVSFSVTEDGRRALRDHLNKIEDPWRLFSIEIEFDGEISTSTVAAKSQSKARYSKYLDIADALPDLTFSDFMKISKVRVDA